MRTITLRKWSQLEKLDVAFPFDYFRGQADASWELSTSLYRALRSRDRIDGITNTEYWMLRDFKRGASRYLSSVPEEDDYIGWLSLMQHHGAPTRLLDFTESFYVACYFALVDSRTDCAVWAIDQDFLLRISEAAFGYRRSGLRDEWEDRSTMEANKYLASFLKSANQSENDIDLYGVIPVIPFKTHTRQSAQQGLFLMPLDVESSIHQNFKPSIKRGERQITKIVLKNDLRQEAMGHLREMNITAETLFPGIDGFAESLLQRQRVF